MDLNEKENVELRLDEVEEPALEIDQAELEDKLIGSLVGGKYRITSKIGSGGAGVVYRAEHALVFGQYFAVKVLVSGAKLDGGMVMRFQREAEASFKLQHPGIVNVVDFGLHDEMPYMAMKLVEGRPLSELLKQGPLSSSHALSLLEQCSEALEYAHSKGVVHRDIKPSNIIVSETADGGVKAAIIDFGIAKIIQGEELSDLTQTGEVFGTPLYMSPEQCQGKKVDQRSDQYSLGCVAYEMISGRPPLEGASLLLTIMRHANEDVPKLKKVQEAPGLELVIDRALERNPEHRYPKIGDMLGDLRKIKEGQSVGSIGRVRGSSRRKLASAGIFIGVFLVTLMSIYFYNNYNSYESRIVRGDFSAYVDRGNYYNKHNNQRYAIADYTKAIEKGEQTARALRNRSASYISIGDYEKGLEDANRALELEPNSGLGLQNKMASLVALKRNEEAIEVGKKILEVDPNNIFGNKKAALEMLSGAYGFLKDWEKEIEYADEALKLNQDDMLARMNRGWARMKLGKSEEAYQDFDYILKVQDKDFWSLVGRGMLNNQLGKFEKAESDLSYAVILDDSSKTPDPYIARAEAYIGLKKFENALKDLEKVRAMGVDSEEVYALRIRTLSGLGRHSEVQQLIAIAQTKYPDSEVVKKAVAAVQKKSAPR